MMILTAEVFLKHFQPGTPFGTRLFRAERGEVILYSCDGQTAHGKRKTEGALFKEDTTLKKRTDKKNSYFTNTNNRIFAENSGNSSGFDIWLDLSGERHYLMHHRHNAMMYVLLKDGISLGELARWKPENVAIVRRYFGGVSIRQIDKMTNSVSNVLKTARKYLDETQETGSAIHRNRSIAAAPMVKHREQKPAVIGHEIAA